MPNTLRNRTMTRLGAAGAAAAFAGLLVAAPASAHVSPDVREVAAGSYNDVQFGVGHGCEDSPTTSIEMQVPEQLNSVTPFVTPGWDISVETETLDEPIADSHGNEVTERDNVVTWTAQEGEALPDGQKIQFGLSFQAPGDAEGETMFFPTVQVCEEGTNDWIAQWDGTGDEPDYPAPAVAVIAGSGDGHGSADDNAANEDDHADADAEGDSDESADAAGDGAATEVADDDDSSNALAVAALVIGLGGVALGGAAFARSGKS